MKIAITGHTSGLGKFIYDSCPNSIGFSKSTGFDLNQKEARAEIIASVYECDVFINNAYDNDVQVKMLYELFDAWADKKRLIVNIGSETTCGIKKKPHNYSAYKAALDKASEQLSHLNAPCKVMNVRFGWLGTDRVIRDYNPEEFITLGDAYTMLMQQIEWASKYRITESLIRP